MRWTIASNSVLIGWHEVDEEPATIPCSVAAYDLDGTIVAPRSGKKYPVDAHDWKFIFGGRDAIKGVLTKHLESNRSLCIISNQKYVPSSRVSFDDHVQNLKLKIEPICKQLGKPIIVLCSLVDDINRKPRPGMGRMLENILQVPVDPSTSIYVGDAAGRPGDHAACDYHFALNLGWKFLTPELSFMKSPFIIAGISSVKLPPVLFDPRKLDRENLPTLQDLPCLQPYVEPSVPTTIILVGPPGAGKSFLAKRVLSKYKWINQDALKTRPAVIKMLQSSVAHGESVVIDRQNHQIKDRLDFIQTTPKYRHICLHLDVPKAYAEHCNVFRSIAPLVPEYRRDLVPPMIIHSYYKTKQQPTMEEGFDAIENINLKMFVPGPFTSLEDRNLFCSFLRNKISEKDSQF